jgi:hypothetical protein
MPGVISVQTQSSGSPIYTQFFFTFIAIAIVMADVPSAAAK